ncbi:MAG TPA: phospholipid carrier-dependent glycosyltransferase [Bryobacteraceae bacterium]
MEAIGPSALRPVVISEPGRLFWPAAGALLVFLATVQILSSLRESNIADETTELAAGYSYWRTGDFRMNPEHPPLAKLLAAAPLLAFRLKLPVDSASWANVDELRFGVEFFDVNVQKVDMFLLAARLTSISVTFFLGLSIALWARATFGPAAALIALVLYSFDPTIIAHGRYVKNDVPLALFAFLACIAWGAFLKRPAALRLLAASVALGLGLATKFSALYLLPVFAIVLVIRRWQSPRGFSLRLGIFSLFAVATLAACVVFLVYAVPAAAHGVRLRGFDFHVLRDLLDRSESGALARIAHPVARTHPFFEGLTIFLDHNTVGHPSYLLGMHGMKGWWYYFPVAFAVKMPVSTLIFLALAGFTGVRMLGSVRLRSVSFSWFVLAASVLVFCALCLAGHVDIGVRYELPAWPPLLVLSAAIFTRARFRHAAAILSFVVLGLAVESISIYPHYLAFFNVLAGGPSRGAKILADSNIDWGQDAKELRIWLRAHPAPRFCVDYFGTAKLEWLGIGGPSLAYRWSNERRVLLDCVAVVSVNQLEGVYVNPGEYAWLRSISPDARIGYSIYVYDLPRRASLGLLPLPAVAPAPVFLYVLHQDFRGPPTIQDPALPGEIVSFFMTGLGPLDPPIPLDKPAPENRLGYTELPLFCQWNASRGGPMAEVLYAGSAPRRIGVYQVNVRVSRGISSSRLTCQVGLLSGDRSEPASIAVPVAD